MSDLPRTPPRRWLVASVDTLLSSERPEEAVTALSAALHLRAGTPAAGELRDAPDPALGALSAAAEAALAGAPAAAEEYVRHWRDLAEATLAAVRRARPELALDRGAAALHLLWGALDAPFSGWVAERGLAEGLALGLVERLRSLAPGARPLAERPAASPVARLAEEDWLRFHTRVEAALRAVAGSTGDLDRLRQLFDLTLTEVGTLFGTSRQAATKWLREGLPAARRAKAATVVSVGELLERKLRPGRLPAVARRPADAYGGRTMLERIAAGEHQELLAEVRASFDWAATA